MSEQTDTIEAVALAVRATCGLSDRESADIAQAAIASHTKALIEGAGEVERRLLDHAHMIQRDGLGAMLDTATQAAATIAALQAELAGAKEAIRDVLQMAEARISALNQMDEPDNQADTIAALRAEIERAKEEGVRAGIEAAANKAMAYRDWVNWTGDTFPDEPGTSIRCLDAAAIAKGV